MKVKVSRTILSEDDIFKFFEATENFGKRFYTIRYNHAPSGRGYTYYDIAIEAIAVSRDLIYKIVWTIGCGTSPKGATRPELPLPFSYSPEREWHKNWFYPFYLESDDAPCIINAFDHRGFIEIDQIEELER